MYKLYFSGTGFHIGVSQSIFKWEPSKDLHLRVKECQKIGQNVLKFAINYIFIVYKT